MKKKVLLVTLSIIGLLTGCGLQKADTDRVVLLDIAMEAVTKMPVFPHLKDRSSEQEKLVKAAVDAGFLDKAEIYIEKIENWRKASAYIYLANAHLDNNESDEVLSKIRAAESIYLSLPSEWFKGRVAQQLAALYIRLGNYEAASIFKNSLISTNQYNDQVRSQQFTGFNERFDSLVAIAEGKEFDSLQYAVRSLVSLLDEYYDQPAKANKILTSIENASLELPYSIRFSTQCQLAEISLRHGDTEKVKFFIASAEKFISREKKDPHLHIPQLAELAELSIAGSFHKNAVAYVNRAEAVYDNMRSKVPSMWLVQMLTPIADAYVLLNDMDKATMYYQKALNEGMINPNARVRSMDLSRILIAMFESGFKPDAETLTRLQVLNEGLVAPW